MTTLSSEQASRIGRIGAHSRWAREHDRTAATAPAREGFMARFERQVDPDGKLPPAERAFRAEHAMRAHMQQLSLKRARKRASHRRNPHARSTGLT